MARTVFFLHVLLCALLLALPSHSGEQPFKEGISESYFIQLAQRGSGRKGPRMGGSGGVSGIPDPDTLIERMDSDGDGRITKDEFKGPKDRFGRLDSDGDGYVTKQEMAVGLGHRQAQEKKLAQHPNAAWHANLPIILTHTHIVALVSGGRNGRTDWNGAAERAVKEMERNGVRASIIMPPPADRKDNSFFRELIKIAKKYPNRFKVLGGGHSLNPMINGIKPDRVDDGDRRKFTEIAEEIIAKGGVGFGETTALHMSFQDWHPFEEVQPDHPLYLLLADLAAKHDVPLDIHMEAVAKKWTVTKEFHKRSPNNPNYVDENLEAFERLLAHNRKAKIIWVHLGMDSTEQRSPALSRRLLRTYPNLYVSLKPLAGMSLKYPLFTRGTQLNPEWKNLIIEFPDRFMIGSDTFFQPEFSDLKLRQNLVPSIKIVRSPLLPPSIARKVAFENAQRIFKINLIDPKDYPLPATSGGQTKPKSATGSQMMGSSSRAAPKAQKGPQSNMMIRNMDQDGDGRVARSEFRGPPQRFGMIDANKDGFLTLQEFNQILGGRRGGDGNRPVTKVRPQKPRPHATKELVGPMGLTASQIIANTDRDGDGKITASEFRGPPPAFMMLDADSDGFLTKKEFEDRWR